MVGKENLGKVAGTLVKIKEKKVRKPSLSL